MSMQEAARRQRQSEQDRARNDDHRVLSFAEFCALNGFSQATGRRIIKQGIGPAVTQLSARRIGVTVANNAKWQASRTRASA
jgi:predicted DNA-binding transcriptional regulator AlpA